MEQLLVQIYESAERWWKAATTAIKWPSTQRALSILCAALLALLVVAWVSVVLQHDEGVTARALRHDSDLISSSYSPHDASPLIQHHVGPKVQLDTWPYKCWTPSQQPNPEVTIVTICGGLPKTYLQALRANRLQYAQRYGYRYCEVKTIDHNHIGAFSKLPTVLALLPCTDFLWHIDADAMIYNMSLSLQPWMDFMKQQDVQQLLSADVILQSPINFGVFMLRRAAWLWPFYQKLYNMCTCDWHRNYDWPAEQGTLYDLLAISPEDSDERLHTRIVPPKVWNHVPRFVQELPLPEDLIFHIVWPSIFANGSKCYANMPKMPQECKQEGLDYYMRSIIMAGKDIGKDMSDYFVEDDNICHQVRTEKFFSGSETYANKEDEAYSSSVMNFDVNFPTKTVSGIQLGEVGCRGHREINCFLTQQWDGTKGSGPFAQSCGPLGGQPGCPT